MAQTIKIKRSTASAAPATIAAGELAYSKGSQTLYIGDPDTNNANTPLPIGPAIINNAGTPSRATGVTATELQQIMDTEVGVDVQAYDAGLADIAGLSTADGNFIVGNGTNWVVESLSTARTSLGLGSLATLNSVGASQIDANAVGASELNVSGNGTAGQVLASDGDGTMTWTTVANTDVDVSVTNLVDRLDDINTNVTIGNGTSVTVTTSGDLEVSGDLTVQGTTTTVNSETVNIADNFMLLNSNQSTGSAGTENAGIEVNRGSSTNTQLRWSETADRWQFSNDGTNFDNIPVPSEYAPGDITRVSITAGTGIASSGSTDVSSGNFITTLSVDLSELTDMTAAVDRTQDELILLDNGADRRKLISEIDVSSFDTENPSFTGDQLFLDSDHTGAARTTGTTGIYVERGDSPDAYIYYNHSTGLWSHGVGSGVKTMGTITGVTGGTGINPDTEDTTGNVTLSLDLSELTDMTEAMVSTDEFIVLDNGADRRKAASEISLAVFDNSTTGFTSNVGDITAVTVRNNSDQASADESIVFGTTGGSNSATVSSGSATFRVQVGTIDGGTY